MPAIEDFLADATRRMDKSIESTRQEFNSVRTGRASPALLDRVQVDYYGTPTPLKNLASISAPEPRLLNVQPFAPSSANAIEKATQQPDPSTGSAHSGAAASRGRARGRDRHGRERPLGPPARPADRRRPPGRDARAAADGRGGDRPRRRVARRLRLLDRELDAARGRGRGADGDLRRDDRARAPRPGQRRRADAVRGPAWPSPGRAPRADGGDGGGGGGERAAP